MCRSGGAIRRHALASQDQCLILRDHAAGLINSRSQLMTSQLHVSSQTNFRSERNDRHDDAGEEDIFKTFKHLRT
jgi:hypothetical protein